MIKLVISISFCQHFIILQNSHVKQVVYKKQKGSYYFQTTQSLGKCVYTNVSEGITDHKAVNLRCPQNGVNHCCGASEKEELTWVPLPIQCTCQRTSFQMSYFFSVLKFETNCFAQFAGSLSLNCDISSKMCKGG